MPRKKTTVKKTKVKQKQNVNVRVVVNSNNKRKTVRLGRSQQQQQQERQQQQPTNSPQVIQVPQFIDRPTQTGFDKNEIIDSLKTGFREIYNEAKYNEDQMNKREKMKDQEPPNKVYFSSKQDPAIKDEPKDEEKKGFQEKESVNTGMTSVSEMKRKLDSIVKKDSKDDDLEPQTPSLPKIPTFNLDGEGRGAKMVSQATSSVPFNSIDMIRRFLVDQGKYTSVNKAKLKVSVMDGRSMMLDPGLRQKFTNWYNNR